MGDNDYIGPERRVHESKDIVKHVERANTVMRWLSAAIISVLVLGLGVILLITAITLERQQTALDSLEQIETDSVRDRHEHRIRNELLHACIVDLIFAVVESEPGERGDIPNPCPAGDQPPVEIPDVNEDPLLRDLDGELRDLGPTDEPEE